LTRRAHGSGDGSRGLAAAIDGGYIAGVAVRHRPRPGPQLPGRLMADAVARREKKITCEYLTLTGWPFAPGCAECAVLARLWWPVEG
jgi:hypothetical protein